MKLLGITRNTPGNDEWELHTFILASPILERALSLAQQKVIDFCAHWIGAHALALLLVIFLTVLGVIAVVWNLLERRGLELWAHPDGWHRRVLERPFAQMLRQRYPRVWRFSRARLAPDSYLGLHLTIGLLVTLAAMVGFGALADAVTDQEELTEFDQQLAISLHQNGTIDQVGMFEAITRFGDYRTLAWLGLAVSLILLISRCWLMLVGWVVALAGSGFLNAMLKALFHRVRPVFANPWLTEPGWSFPSGHAMGSLVAYGMLAYILIVAWRIPFPRTDYCRVHSFGARDRLESNLPWRAFLQRRGRRLRGRNDVVSNLFVRLRSCPTP